MAILCEWGPAGIEALRPQAAVFVIVDVLSFSTAVSVAVERGASIIPFPFGDQDAAEAAARAANAVAARPRRAEGGQLSLSPASLRRLEPGERVLLPSPNGSHLSLMTGEVPTLCGCLRNAAAVARAAGKLAAGGDIAVIPAGERWADGSLRPATEDLLGAGAIVSRLAGERAEVAFAAEMAFRGASPHLAAFVKDTRSGRELIGRGYEGDVEIALEIDVSDAAPLLADGAYRRL